MLFVKAFAMGLGMDDKDLKFAVEDWILECCLVSRQYRITTDEAFTSFREFASREWPEALACSRSRFGRALVAGRVRVERCLLPDRALGYAGIALKSE